MTFENPKKTNPFGAADPRIADGVRRGLREGVTTPFVAQRFEKGHLKSAL